LLICYQSIGADTRAVITPAGRYLSANALLLHSSRQTTPAIGPPLTQPPRRPPSEPIASQPPAPVSVSSRRGRRNIRPSATDCGPAGTPDSLGSAVRHSAATEPGAMPLGSASSRSTTAAIELNPISRAVSSASRNSPSSMGIPAFIGTTNHHTKREYRHPG